MAWSDGDYARRRLPHVPGRCKFIAIMPQWDFLNFLADTLAGSRRFGSK